MLELDPCYLLGKNNHWNKDQLGLLNQLRHNKNLEGTRDSQLSQLLLEEVGMFLLGKQKELM